MADLALLPPSSSRRRRSIDHGGVTLSFVVPARRSRLVGAIGVHRLDDTRRRRTGPGCRPRVPRRRASATPRLGSWYRIDPALQAGALTGQRLVVGLAPEQVRTLALDAESFAAGPFGRIVLVGTDDGTRTRLSLIDWRGRAHGPSIESADVIRTATLAPDRADDVRDPRRPGERADLGVWRRALDGSTPGEPVLRPIQAGRPVRADVAHRPGLERRRHVVGSAVVRRGRVPRPRHRDGR